jgi:hypothetical protein
MPAPPDGRSILSVVGTVKIMTSDTNGGQSAIGTAWRRHLSVQLIEPMRLARVLRSGFLEITPKKRARLL